MNLKPTGGPVRAVAVVLVLLLAGCLSKAPAGDGEAQIEPTEDDEATDDRRFAGDGNGQPQTSQTARLGSISSGPGLPARIPFTVTVSERGVDDVEWFMRFPGPSVPAEQRIEGPGCVPETGITVSNVEFTYRGSCSDLAPGEYQFEVVLDLPTQGFTAWVEGQQSINETAGP